MNLIILNWLSYKSFAMFARILYKTLQSSGKTIQMFRHWLGLKNSKFSCRSCMKAAFIFPIFGKDCIKYQASPLNKCFNFTEVPGGSYITKFLIWDLFDCVKYFWNFFLKFSNSPTQIMVHNPWKSLTILEKKLSKQIVKLNKKLKNPWKPWKKKLLSKHISTQKASIKINFKKKVFYPDL